MTAWLTTTRMPTISLATPRETESNRCTISQTSHHPLKANALHNGAAAQEDTDSSFMCPAVGLFHATFVTVACYAASDTGVVVVSVSLDHLLTCLHCQFHINHAACDNNRCKRAGGSPWSGRHQRVQCTFTTLRTGWAAYHGLYMARRFLLYCTKLTRWMQRLLRLQTR